MPPLRGWPDLPAHGRPHRRRLREGRHDACDMATDAGKASVRSDDIDSEAKLINKDARDHVIGFLVIFVIFFVPALAGRL